ncbi:MAG TPA: type II secretion system protein [Thermodesulfovibrionales bacterium]|jgi:prepilin-type N-terminal cleavage/methylation domain-containing protein|nr:type II secretion system protein [Thermodesulfovibrionales bacterium]
METNKGLTLIEILVAMSVIGILSAAIGFFFEGWASTYRIESQIKEMYANLMKARVQAMQVNRVHFVTLSPTHYAVFDDTNPASEGNNILETSADRQILLQEFDAHYPIAWSGAADTRITLTARGFSNDKKTICMFSSKDPDYDCIEISATRINIGKILKQPAEGGRCISENCESR